MTLEAPAAGFGWALQLIENDNAWEISANRVARNGSVVRVNLGPLTAAGLDPLRLRSMDQTTMQISVAPGAVIDEDELKESCRALMSSVLTGDLKRRNTTPCTVEQGLCQPLRRL